MPLKKPTRALDKDDKRIYDEHARKYEINEAILAADFPLQEFDSTTELIYLGEEYVAKFFRVIESAYYNLYVALFWEEFEYEQQRKASEIVDYVATGVAIAGAAANAIPLVGQAVSLVLSVVSGIMSAFNLLQKAMTQKFKEYPEEVKLLKGIVESVLNFAKIKPHNKRVILSGVSYYIEMQKEEYNDFVTEDGYLYLGSTTINAILGVLIPQLKKSIVDIKDIGSSEIIGIQDKLIKGAGKDLVNEIEFAANPISDAQVENEKRITKESNADRLDLMRNRQTREYAGGEKYDFEYANVGFDIKLEKTQEIDNTKLYANNVAIAQTIKSFALMLCSNHFCEYYEATLGWNDICHVNKHKVTDMRESEINPYISKFNAESKTRALKARLNRYSQGLAPANLIETHLDLIDESIKGYYKQWLKYYSMGFATDFIEYDEERNFLYFKDIEREVIMQNEGDSRFTNKKKTLEHRFSTMQILISFDYNKYIIDYKSAIELPDKIELMQDFDTRVYFDDSDANKKVPLYFNVSSEFLSIESVKERSGETYYYGDGGEAVSRVYSVTSKYKLIFSKRIFKDALQNEIAKAVEKAIKQNKFQKEHTNIDKLKQNRI